MSMSTCRHAADWPDRDDDGWELRHTRDERSRSYSASWWPGLLSSETLQVRLMLPRVAKDSVPASAVHHSRTDCVTYSPGRSSYTCISRCHATSCVNSSASSRIFSDSTLLAGQQLLCATRHIVAYVIPTRLIALVMTTKLARTKRNI